MKGRQVSSSFDIALRVLDVDDTLHETIDYWNRISKFLSLGLQEDILRLSDWFEKSFKEKDLIQRFILSWIGFNGLYNLYCDSIYKNLKLNEAEKFEKMVDELIGISEKANIVKNNAKNINKLIDFNILSDNGKTNWSKRLKEEMGKHEKDFKEIIKLIIRCIYGIRKQVFHEAPRPIDVKERTLFAKSILEPIAFSCLKNITNIKPS